MGPNWGAQSVWDGKTAKGAESGRKEFCGELWGQEPGQDPTAGRIRKAVNK